MPSSDPLWTDILQTIFVGGQLVLLVVAALFGWSQLSEAKELREEQTRPFVVIDLDSPKKPFFDLVVKNLGATMARDVKFDFDPPAKSTMKEAAPDRLKMFRDGISTLPPGKEIRTLFDTGIKRFKSDLPDVYEVRVSYRGPTGEKQYRETLDLDFGLYWNRLSVTRYGVHDVFKELQTMRKEMAKWTASLGGGLLQVTPPDMENRRKDIERQLEERRARREDAD